MDDHQAATWSEDTSQRYRALAAAAVPRRHEQLATLLALLPLARDTSARVVELAAGEGLLSEAILRAWPAVQVLVMDGSAAMRAACRERLAPYVGRAHVADFDLLHTDWHGQIDGAQAVLCSLSLHHLDADGKRSLFRAAHERLAPGGALLIADLVAPQDESVRHLFADQWDEATRTQSQVQASDDSLFELFQREEWNHYRTPDPVDKPSGLFEQLGWLAEAGFQQVDCWWMVAGHAIYGGYKAGSAVNGLGYAAACDIAAQVMP